MRPILLALILALSLPAQDTFGPQVERFVNEMDVWLRSYQGCPAVGPVTRETCLGGPVNDARAWHRAREAAKDLFHLQDLP